MTTVKTLPGQIKFKYLHSEYIHAESNAPEDINASFEEAVANQEFKIGITKKFSKSASSAFDLRVNRMAQISVPKDEVSDDLQAEERIHIEGKIIEREDNEEEEIYETKEVNF